MPEAGRSTAGVFSSSSFGQDGVLQLIMRQLSGVGLSRLLRSDHRFCGGDVLFAIGVNRRVGGPGRRAA